MTDQPEPCTRCGQHHPRCKGHKRDGNPCGQWPRHGARVCKRHGGNAPQVRAAADRRVQQAAAEKAVATYGLPREVAPDVALLEEVHRTAGHVTWLAGKVADLSDEDLTWGVVEEVDKRATEFGGTDTTSKAVPNVWLQLYQQERKHLVLVCKAALDAGIAERQVKLAEQQGALLAGAIHRILGRLELTRAQRTLVATVVPEELRALRAADGNTA